ncbi:MAG: glycogen/starch synthase [Candidatus Pacebacteria bacterium]|nr:glycogen/starch synthase [Candidatus Paceibacterota bacterium]
MLKALKILFVTTDLSPFSKAGGLGDVSCSLPKALLKAGLNIRIIMPRHGVIDEKKHNIKLIKDNLKVKIIKNTEINFRIKKGNLTKELPVYFIDKFKYFGGRNKIYGYKDENQRFMFFNFAVFEAIRNMNNWVPDIIHCNDWHNGLIPYLLKTKFSKEEILKKTKTIFTIHNLTFQLGKNWWEIDKKEQDDGVSKLPDFKDRYKIDRINFAKRGILSADIINTVSEKYAEEIIQKKFGQDLYNILLVKHQEKRFFGIINGIDYKEYNPQTDPGLWINYDHNSLQKKVINKMKLQEDFGLEIDDDVPLIAMATRITEQKGFDLILEIIDALLRLNMQLILIGSADSDYKKIFKKLSKKNPKKVATHLKFETKKITRVYASSDMFLMPSRFEPCGLGQMISLRYGSIPIVRETGGLSDTITNYNPRTKNGNGFVFKTYDPQDLLVAIVRALETYKYKEDWRNLAKKGMQESFSWEVPAKKYNILYKKAINLKIDKKFMYQTIEDINKKIKELAKKECFKIIKPVSYFIKKKKNYYAHNVLKGNKKIFLKARITANKGYIFGIEKGMKISKIMTENKKISNKVNFTGFLGGSLKEIPEWYVYNYIEGNILGDFYNMPKKHEKEVYIKNSVKNLRNLQSVSNELIKEAEKNGVIEHIKKRGYTDYCNTVEYYEKQKVEDGKIDFASVYKLLEKNKKALDENFVIAHGDFTLANQIVSDKDGKVYLSDWDSVRIDNIAADLTHLWVQTWRYPAWRSKLLQEFLGSISATDKNKFKEIFRITAIEQAMAEIKWNSTACKKKYKKGVIDISIKTIKTALEGFEWLIEI